MLILTDSLNGRFLKEPKEFSGEIYSKVSTMASFLMAKETDLEFYTPQAFVALLGCMNANGKMMHQLMRAGTSL